MSVESFIYTADKEGERLDVFLTRCQPDLSRSHIQKIIAAGQATVDGTVRRGNYKLKLGQQRTYRSTSSTRTVTSSS